jgi:hypothetical protein
MQIGTAYIANNVLRVLDGKGNVTYSQAVSAFATVAGYTSNQVTLVFSATQNVNYYVVINADGTVVWSRFF